jgi:hypothetical protein
MRFLQHRATQTVHNGGGYSLSRRATRAARRHRVDVVRVRTPRDVGFTVLTEGRSNNQDRLLTARGRVLLVASSRLLRRTLARRGMHDLDDPRLWQFLEETPRLEPTRRCDLVGLQGVVSRDVRDVMRVNRGPLLDGLDFLPSPGPAAPARSCRPPRSAPLKRPSFRACEVAPPPRVTTLHPA